MYRLYVDEVGSEDLTHLDKDKHRFLSLTGIAMPIAHARDHLTPEMNKIKAQVFEHDPDHPIIFHRKEILGLKGPYGRLKNPETHKLFNAAIMRLLDSADYAVITALIDKQWMLRQRHWRKNHPYHYLMEILVEKFVQFLERKGAIGDLMPEARMGMKDHLLQAAFDEVRTNGTDYVNKERIQSALRGSKLKLRRKVENISGLQLCDLVAHPSHIYTRSIMKHVVNLGPFSTQVVKILCDSKYDRSHSGRIIGYGIKHLP